MYLKTNEYAELKRTTGELNDAMYDISAILDKHGNGALYFGLKNDGTPNPFIINIAFRKTIEKLEVKSIRVDYVSDKRVFEELKENKTDMFVREIVSTLAPIP